MVKSKLHTHAHPLKPHSIVNYHANINLDVDDTRPQRRDDDPNDDDDGDDDGPPPQWPSLHTNDNLNGNDPSSGVDDRPSISMS